MKRDQRRADTLADALRPDAAPTGEATTAEQLAAVLSGVVDIADAVEDEAHEQRARAVERPGRQLIELAHPEGQALAANKIACAVRGLLAGQGEAAKAYTAPLREQIAAANARAEAAERERDAATARVAALTKDRDDNVDELVNCLAEREDDRRQASDALGHLRIRAEIAETERAAARRECDALRAIVEGRTAPPSAAEIAAHEAAGGLWWVIVRTESLDEHPVVYDTASARALAAYQRNADPEAAPIRWWALSRNRIPCAWPVVDGVSR